jgi:hypothetical protein
MLRAEQDIDQYVKEITEHIAELSVDEREARLMNLIIALCEDLDEMGRESFVLLSHHMHRIEDA